MATVDLTAAFCDAAHYDESDAATGKDRLLYWDRALPSFGLCVTNRNAKSWVVQYRAAGRSHRKTLARYHVMSLADAKREARKLMGDVARGGDPVTEQRAAVAAEQARQGDTLAAVARNWLRRQGAGLRSLAKRQAAVERNILPVLGARPIGEITRTEVTALLDQIEDERGPVAADQALNFLRALFNWHAARVDNFRSPIVRGMARTKPHERARKRVLTDSEIRAIWAATVNPHPYHSLVRFLLLTGCRREEACGMKRAELVEHGTVWAIPAHRHKSKEEARIPLSKAAREVIAAVPRFVGCDYVFTIWGRGPLVGLDDFKTRLQDQSRTRDWTQHDLRRTVRTRLSALTTPDIAERCLTHKIGGVRGVYDRHQYMPEMQEAFNLLAQEISAITTPLTEKRAKRPWRRN
jgi:integrase